MRIYLKRLYVLSHLIITPTEFSKKSIKRLELKKKPPIYAVSNCIKIEKFKEKKEYRDNFRNFLKKKYSIPLDATIILNVGYTWERKGPDEFWQCAKKLPDYWFVWVGPIKDFAKTLPPIKNCIFTGFYDNICEPYYGADLLLFPSFAENQGIPLMEAAICNLPILARDIEPIDWLIHNESCIKAKTHEEFINGIEKILSDATFREKITKNAHSVTDKLHNFEKIGDRVEKLYYRAIKLKNLYLQKSQKQ
jgi:glycosyltransferase involved in cell wall biosynthesis